MVARFTGASLGLLAFTIAVVCGLVVRNPVTVTLSRGILALFVFFVIGIVLGGIAQVVLNEHERRRMSEIDRKYPRAGAGGAAKNTTEAGSAGSSTG
jgi:hypothetical protein